MGQDELYLTLEEVAGGCRFELVNVLSDPGTAAMNAAGWHVCLSELGKVVRGEPSAGPHAANATEWQPLYDEYVAAGLPQGTPVPGR